MRVLVRLTQAALLAGIVTTGSGALAHADGSSDATTGSTVVQASTNGIGTDWP